MKSLSVFALLVSALMPAFAQTDAPSSEIQILTATLAAPSDHRAGATVYASSEDGNYKLLRKGNNDMVCLADDPSKADINVTCYHSSLQPFMERGWALKKEGKNAKEVFDIREAEVKAGKLMMPKQTATLYALSGSQNDYDMETGALKNSYLRYVVYIPFATSESTGLPLKPDVAGQPWIMDPGTHRAHIMINPAKN